MTQKIQVEPKITPSIDKIRVKGTSLEGHASCKRVSHVLAGGKRKHELQCEVTKPSWPSTKLAREWIEHPQELWAKRARSMTGQTQHLQVMTWSIVKDEFVLSKCTILILKRIASVYDTLHFLMSSAMQISRTCFSTSGQFWPSASFQKDVLHWVKVVSLTLQAYTCNFSF